MSNRFRSLHQGAQLGAAIAFMCPMGFASPAAAAAPAQEQSARADNQLEEVVVSASRRGAQDLQTTSISITALDTESLNRSGLNMLNDIVRSVPGIAVQELGGGQNDIVVRGITTRGTPNPTDVSVQPTVSVYVDETPIS